MGAEPTQGPGSALADGRQDFGEAPGDLRGGDAKARPGDQQAPADPDRGESADDDVVQAVVEFVDDLVDGPDPCCGH